MGSPTETLNHSTKMKFLILIALVIVSSSAESEIETDSRFFGGIFGDLFGNNNQCSNCRYNLQEASYCCRSGIDTYCCNYSNNLINGNGNYDPEFNPIGGSNFYKPGSCPSNYYGRRKRRSPEDAPGSRFYPNNNNGGLNWNNNNGYNSGSCYSDRDCQGRQKCCTSSYGQRTCTYPTNYYG